MHCLHVSVIRCVTFALPAVLALACGISRAQGAETAASSSTTGYDPRITFAPLTLPDPVNAYRSSNGAPGPQYWQNEADYDLHAALDTANKTLTVTETITYTNNSPDVLDCLWIQLEQNMYKGDSRARIVNGAMFRNPRGRPGEPSQRPTTDGNVIKSVEVESDGKTTKADYLVNDTRMQVRLKEPLKPRGGRLKVHIAYSYEIPGAWGGRTSWVPVKDGEIYDMAQWYPRISVYDDLRGWDTLPYIGAEFYLEYGTFDYYVTVPAEMIVAGSGELVNAKDVLTPDEIARLAQARSSDKTVYIRTPAEVAAKAGRPNKSGPLTWHFHMDHTRDVVWSASQAFVWDAARMNLPEGKTALAMSVYPPEGVGANAWDMSTAYTKDTIERFSKHWFPYPWPEAVSIGGGSSGMEYPGVVFDGYTLKGKDFFWLTAHEFGHSWFPMIVGSNERRHAFMDEGFNTFIDIEESAMYEGGKYGPKRDSEYSGGGEPPDMILKVLDNPEAPALMALADSYGFQLGHPVSYFKGAYGMVLLREQILGTERFDWAFRKYIRDWAFKHPSPSDFFREMQSEGGEDLSWFWRGWYMENWKYDVAVDKIDGDTVTLSNRGQLVLPTTVEATFKDGSKTRVLLPVETWMSKGTYAWTPESKSPIASVVVDPDHVLPDDDRSNNMMKAD